jgi:DNA-binding XRE family transcriptional regulator
VWIVSKGNLANSVVRYAAASNGGRKAGYLFLLLNARSAILPPLEKRFKAVAVASSILPPAEFDEVLKLSDREDRFIGGIVDVVSKTVTLWRGNFDSITVPFKAFPTTANDIRPSFDKFSVIDYGQTLKFGSYESDAEAVLYEYAPDFRRRLKQTRLAEENSLGASIRRLRKQKRLTRDDFGIIDPKTIARIEHGKVTPRASTLKEISKILGVPHTQLGTY